MSLALPRRIKLPKTRSERKSNFKKEKKRDLLKEESENNPKWFLGTKRENASELKRRMRKFIYSMANFPKAGGVYFEALASMGAGTVQKSSDC